MNELNTAAAFAAFRPGETGTAQRYGTGHINDTFLVTAAGGQYILQRINTSIFRQPVELMENFTAVCSHIAGKVAAEKAADPGCRRRVIEVLTDNSGSPCHRDDAGNCWRCYRFIDGARTYDVLETPKQAYEAARAFGGFQNDLADLPVRLHETIAKFHHTPDRFAKLLAAVKADACGRLKNCGPELEYIVTQAADYHILVDGQAAGELVERTTHNDTKLNNVLISDETQEGVCVIDLDTVMPGLPHYDFGDMVRTGTSPAPEDELDLSKVGMRFTMFEALLRGYLSRAGKFLNPREKELLPLSGKIITLEIGMRFLTDYLEGDVYFKVHRDGHNLDRCRTQIALAQSIETQFDAMRRLNDSL